jgi:hypothetical protein
MQPFDEPKSPTPAKKATIVIILAATTMIGASSGILIADRDALRLLKKPFASQLPGVRGCLLPSANAASVKPETPDVIPIGLRSIVAIEYSSKPGSAHIEFDLQSTDLVRTGKLRSPDRIYFDLQDRSRERGTVSRLSKQKSVNIAGALLTRVRASQREQGDTRIVLDLKRPCDFTYQTLFGSQPVALSSSSQIGRTSNLAFKR